MKENSAISVKGKLAYGMGDFAINVAYTTLGFYIVFFLVNVAGIPAELAGLIFLIARAWDALTDFVMGTISDRTVSRFGRRRPYILFGAIPLGITFTLLWIVPFEGITALVLYYLAMTIAFNTAFTVVAIPYNSLLPELSGNYDERTSISGYRMALTFVGNLLAAAGVAVIVDVLYPGKEAYRESYPVMGMSFAVIMIVSLMVTFAGTRERVRSATTRTESILSSFRSVMRLKEFRFVLGMFLFNMIGFDLIQAIFIFFLKDVIRVSEDMTFVIMGIPLITAALAAPFWIMLSKRLEKRGAYISAALFFTVTLLGWFGYIENSKAPQPESAVLAIRLLMGIGPGIFFLISAAFVAYLPLNKQRFNEVQAALEKRRAAS